MKASQGLTIVEMLVALAVIGIALVVLAQSQILNLQQSARARSQTDLKASLVAGLEYVEQAVLTYERVPGVFTTSGAPQNAYAFSWYWNNCGGTPIGGVYLPSNAATLQCSFTVPDSVASGVTVTIRATTGHQNEGLLNIVVTGTRQRESASLFNTVTCYDVYPAPTRDRPVPCPPTPTLAGTGS